MDSDAKELGHVRAARLSRMAPPRGECDRASLPWQQCSQLKIAYDLRVNSRSQSTPTRALSQKPQAPEARMSLAADHQMVVDRDAERLGGFLDFLRHLDVLARRLGIAGRVVVHRDDPNSRALKSQGKRSA